jgi:hypothetical protein
MDYNECKAKEKEYKIRPVFHSKILSLVSGKLKIQIFTLIQTFRFIEPADYQLLRQNSGSSYFLFMKIY